MEEINVYGIIYRIVNIKNNKSYVGKTKSHRGTEPFGIEKRFVEHKTRPFSNTKNNEIPLLYEAIREYGVENFVIETLLTCNLEHLNNNEKKMISIYDSNNPNFGYNTQSGGEGPLNVVMSEETRKKISDTLSKTDDKEMGITKIFDDDNELIGYSVCRKEHGKDYRKWFSSTERSPEENYKLAKQCLEDIKNNTFVDNPNNKKYDLPQGVFEVKNENNEVHGYSVSIMVKRKVYNKKFVSKKNTLHENLMFALEWKDNIREGNVDFVSEYDDKKYIWVNKKNGIPNGYRICLPKSIDVEQHIKKFLSSKLTMEEKYELAVEWRNEQLEDI